MDERLNVVAAQPAIHSYHMSWERTWRDNNGGLILALGARTEAAE